VSEEKRRERKKRMLMFFTERKEKKKKKKRCVCYKMRDSDLFIGVFYRLTVLPTDN
jgi:hypothetical protein